MEDVAALFAQSREVGANDGEGVGAGDGAETAGGFLLQFGHADIAFGLIVVEWHARIGEKAQHIVSVLSQADEQVDGGGLFDTSPAPRPLSRGRIVAFAFGEDGAVSAAQGREPLSVDCAMDPLAASASFLAARRKSIIFRVHGCWVVSSR